MTTPAPPGWYDDPQDPAAQRYWDGQDWTPERARKPITGGAQSRVVATDITATPPPADGEMAPQPTSATPQPRLPRGLIAVLVAIGVVLTAGLGIASHFLLHHSPAAQLPMAATPSTSKVQPASPAQPAEPTTQPARTSVPFCKASACAFLSPLQGLNCEIDWQSGPGIPNETYCQTSVPPQTVHMDATGTLTTCVDVVHADASDKCDIGDPGYGSGGVPTPTLGYGQATGIGPFTCLSEASGVTCTVPGGGGFTMSSRGIAPVG
jgi:hypothetical protein